MFHKIYFRIVNATVLVLPNVFIAAYGIAKCIREIIRGSVMCRYLMTNELILDQMNTLYNTPLYDNKQNNREKFQWRLL